MHRLFDAEVLRLRHVRASQMGAFDWGIEELGIGVLHYFCDLTIMVLFKAEAHG